MDITLQDGFILGGGIVLGLLVWFISYSFKRFRSKAREKKEIPTYEIPLPDYKAILFADIKAKDKRLAEIKKQVVQLRMEYNKTKIDLKELESVKSMMETTL
jgi:hypothetical protein